MLVICTKGSSSDGKKWCPKKMMRSELMTGRWRVPIYGQQVFLASGKMSWDTSKALLLTSRYNFQRIAAMQPLTSGRGCSPFSLWLSTCLKASLTIRCASYLVSDILPVDESIDQECCGYNASTPLSTSDGSSGRSSDWDWSSHRVSFSSPLSLISLITSFKFRSRSQITLISRANSCTGSASPFYGKNLVSKRFKFSTLKSNGSTHPLFQELWSSSLSIRLIVCPHHVLILLSLV